VEVVYPEPSTNRKNVTATISKAEEEDGEICTNPETESNNSAISGNERPAKGSVSDPKNDSGFGSTSDTPSLSRAPDFIPLESKGISQNGEPTLNLKRKHSEESEPICISNDEESDGDPDEDGGNSTPGSESSGADSGAAANQTLDTFMKSLKNQKRFFKCDYCDFKAPNKGRMKNHLKTTGHLFAAEIMGSFENETFHCKSIIEPLAVNLTPKEKHMSNFSDLVLMCPVCLSHFPSIVRCVNHAAKSHCEKVYGVGEVADRHVISLPVGLRCLCGEQFSDQSQIGKHLNKCKNFQIKREPNISYFYVCPFCIQLFAEIHGFYLHIQSESQKHNHHQNVVVTVIHVRNPTTPKTMLPYACGPTLQDTSETRVVFCKGKKKAMKAWRKNKSTTLGAYRQMNHNKKFKKC
jgi:hypothetical protein